MKISENNKFFREQRNYSLQDLSKIITLLQGMYYKRSLNEIVNELDEKTFELANSKGDYDKQLEDKSLKYLKSSVEFVIRYLYVLDVTLYLA